MVIWISCSAALKTEPNPLRTRDVYTSTKRPLWRLEQAARQRQVGTKPPTMQDAFTQAPLSSARSWCGASWLKGWRLGSVLLRLLGSLFKSYSVQSKFLTLHVPAASCPRPVTWWNDANLDKTLNALGDGRTDSKSVVLAWESSSGRYQLRSPGIHCGRGLTTQHVQCSRTAQQPQDAANSARPALSPTGNACSNAAYCGLSVAGPSSLTVSRVHLRGMAGPGQAALLSSVLMSSML